MQGLHCPRKRFDDAGGLGRTHQPAAQSLPEATVGAKLHRDEGDASVFAGVEDLHEIRVLNLRVRLGPLKAPPLRVREAAERLMKDLQRDEAVCPEMPRPVDAGKPAATEFLQNLIARDTRPELRGTAPVVCLGFLSGPGDAGPGRYRVSLAAGNAQLPAYRGKIRQRTILFREPARPTFLLRSGR